MKMWNWVCTKILVRVGPFKSLLLLLLIS